MPNNTEIIIRDGDQITISAKEYYNLIQDNKIMTIIGLVLITMLVASLLINIANIIKNK